MNAKFISLILTVVIVATIMIFQATKDSAAHVLVSSDLINRTSTESLTRIRVGGRVSALPIEYVTEPNIKLSFRIQDPGVDNTNIAERSTVPVVYEGLKPDMFAAGRDVIIDGKYENGILYATNLLTQCPSKYEPPEVAPH